MERLRPRLLTEYMNSTASSQPLTLVLGATGKTGARVAARLQQLSRTVRLGSRSAAVPFDWTVPETWAAALAGVDAVYLSFQPDLAVPGAADVIRAFSAAAKRSGVRRLVMLSGRGEPEAQACEQIVMESGLDWTIVQCSWFAQNFSEGAFIDYILAGEVALPIDDVREPFIDADDIADVAVAALTENGYVGQILELTGPRALTFAEAVAEIVTATGRHIAFVPISRIEFVAGLTEAGVPTDVVSLLDHLFSTVLDGRNANPTDGVRRAIGRAPKDFADYAREVAASGIWNVEN